MKILNRVYRFENEEGKGPYFNYPSQEWATSNHCADTGRPGPCEDGIPSQLIDNCFIFGFSSIRQLRKWFHRKERLHLYFRGFKIKVYKNVAGMDTGNQVIFRK
jgi:hypothetical protein